MTVEKYIKVELSRDEQDTLLKASRIISELRDEVGDDEYAIDFEGIANALQEIAYEGKFEIGVKE